MLNILYEDKELLVAEKPAGMESQSSRRFEPDMISEIKNHLKISTKLTTKSSTLWKEPYVGVIHRLDKPVGGIMVYAKTPQAAAALSKQIQDRRMRKTYQTVVCGKPVDIVGNFVDFLLKDGKNNHSSVVDKSVNDSKRAELNYRVLKEIHKEDETLCLVEVELLTGRHHQIRVQFSHHGTPLWGDSKYNPRWADAVPAAGGRRGSGGVSGCALPEAGEAGDCRTEAGEVRGGLPESSPRRNRRSAGKSGRENLALYSVGLSFDHPVSGKRMEFFMKPKGNIFRQFESALAGKTEGR